MANPKSAQQITNDAPENTGASMLYGQTRIKKTPPDGSIDLTGEVDRFDPVFTKNLRNYRVTTDVNTVGRNTDEIVSPQWTSAEAGTYLMPLAADYGPGRTLIVHNGHASQNLTVTRGTGDTIDSNASNKTLAGGGVIQLVSDGISNWIQVSIIGEGE